MTRALLVFNPEATTVTQRVRDVIAHALDDVVSLEVAETKRRDHATELAAAAVADGKAVVFCLGGDGTLNETLNGLVGSDTALAVLPGGGTNVFARTMGLPRDPIEATSVFIERLREGSAPRRIPLGTMNGRRFAFCAGAGLDAEVVREVHRRFRAKQRWGEPYFVTTALRTYVAGSARRRTSLSIDVGDRRYDGMKLAVVGKSDPFTYLGSKAFHLIPRAQLDGGLDIAMFRSLKLRHVTRTVASGFRSGAYVDSRNVAYEHDASAIEIVSAEPVAVQLDGEYIGELTRATFGVERDALAVL